ncbi:DUF1684 domain-containing protein [Phaeacidiphilus oryzae]|uniref:DUF1684 domain-containing protein n=1 Tax=Phaeacidiphilus oryzae TaxID=348818 RepID=UPI000A02B4C7|nr:DUF1684 domain-containing protein [Phaeacidiphilus oryzae]
MEQQQEYQKPRPRLRADERIVAASRAGWEEWRAERLAAVTSPEGNLALIETRWLTDGEEVEPVSASAGLPRTVAVTAVRRTDLATGGAEHGLRFWDSASPAIRAFEGIDVFPYNPEWVLEAEYTPVPGGRLVPFEHIRDNGGSRDLAVPGDLTFTLDDVDGEAREYTLHAFDDEGTLLLVFGDLTNGQDSYGAGRFLFVTPIGEGRALLDFNRAFVPPCGFSSEFNCPMPPPQNRFPFRIEAGEKRPLFRAGFTH